MFGTSYESNLVCRTNSGLARERVGLDVFMCGLVLGEKRNTQTNLQKLPGKAGTHF